MGAPAAGYMIAPQDTSCTAACDQLGRVCDVEYIQYAAQSLQRCLNIIHDLGKKTPHSGQYEDDNSGCVYINAQGGWGQVMRKNALPQCSGQNRTKQRVCYCKEAVRDSDSQMAEEELIERIRDFLNDSW